MDNNGGNTLDGKWQPANCTSIASIAEAARASMPHDQAELFLQTLDQLQRSQRSGSLLAAGEARTPAAEMAGVFEPGCEADASKREQADCVQGEETRKIPKYDIAAGSVETPTAKPEVALSMSRALGEKGNGKGHTDRHEPM